MSFAWIRGYHIPTINKDAIKRFVQQKITPYLGDKMDTTTNAPVDTGNIKPVSTNFNVRSITNGFVVNFMGNNNEIFFGTGVELVSFVAKKMNVNSQDAGLTNSN